MRLFKFTLVLCLVFVITLSAVFYSRSSVVTSVVNHYLTQDNSALTCIDFEVNNNFNLRINRLCIDSPYAEIELIDSLVEWRFEPSKIDVDNISNAISAINIDLAIVRAKSDFKFPENSASNNAKLSELPTLIRKQFHDLSLLSIPFNIDIQTFSYQPFTNKETNKQSPQKENKNQAYQGKLSLRAQRLTFALVNQQDKGVLALALTKSGDDIGASLATDLAELRPFLVRHQTVLPLSFSTLLLNDSWSASGKLNSQLDWHKQTLNLTNQMTDFSFEASQDFSLLGAIALETTFSWQTALAGENLQFDFTPQDKLKNTKTNDNQNYQGNNIQLAFNFEKLIELLTAQAVDPQIIKLLRNNAINTLNVKPSGSLTIDFSQQTLTSDSVDMASRNSHGPIKLSLSDVLLNFDDGLDSSPNLRAAKFSLAGPAHIAQLHPYGRQPVKLSIIGGVEQGSDTWQLTLAQGTAFELTQLSLPSNKSEKTVLGKFQRSKSNTQPRMKSLITHWQGEMSIAKNEIKQQSKNSKAVTFALNVESQIKQLNYPNILKVDELKLTTKLSGNIEEITINTKVIADEVLIATAILMGDIHHPSVIVSAQDVLLTDLLALKLKLPVELKLIDGTIDYQLSGQLKNSEDPFANPMLLELMVQDVTGEVDGTWLQELNWQQKLQLQNGEIK
ncbi:MAG TPA: hypothetical protein DEO86_04320, partial [Colwellia sp.]|nr:hypothetical protein [Colwellia sp.]